MEMSDLQNAQKHITPIYFLIVLGITLILRAFFSLLKAIEYKHRYILPDPKNKYVPLDSNGKSEDEKQENFRRKRWFKRAIISFNGFSKDDPSPDMWYNTFTGTVELFVYPMLIVINEWDVIGAWIGFKTLAQWNQWIKHRLVFNGYVIANMFVIIISYYLAIQILLRLVVNSLAINYINSKIFFPT